jgi:hypothetical protein
MLVYQFYTMYLPIVFVGILAGGFQAFSTKCISIILVQKYGKNSGYAITRPILGRTQKP